MLSNQVRATFTFLYEDSKCRIDKIFSEDGYLGSFLTEFAATSGSNELTVIHEVLWCQALKSFVNHNQIQFHMLFTYKLKLVHCVLCFLSLVVFSTQVIYGAGLLNFCVDCLCG